MQFKLELFPDGYSDGIGNRFYTDDDDCMTLECDLEYCSGYEEYKNARMPTDVDMEDVESTKNDDIKEEVELIKDDGVELNAHEDEDSSVDKPRKNSRGQYNRYSDSQKEKFWQMVIEEGCPINKAALLNGIKLRTGYTWIKNWNRQIWKERQGIHRIPKKRGRKPLLTDEHRDFLKKMMTEDPTVTVEFLLEKLRDKFEGIKVSDSTVFNHVTKGCHFSLKRVSNWAMRRDLDEVKEQRYVWAEEYKEKLDFNKNCVFIDEAGFNTSMRREYGWSLSGEKSVAKVPFTKGVNVSFLGTVSAKGCIALKVRKPVTTAANKKRKIDSDTTKSSGSRGTTANHFYSFIESVIGNINANEDLKDLKYLIVDNAAIHKRRDIQLLVALSGLELVFLPPYSPSLNAIEEFWSVCKSKVKRSLLTKKEQLTPRVKEATNAITVESFEGFCRHAEEHVELCLNRLSF